MYQALDRQFGIEISVADPPGELARFYAERTRLADANLADLQFKRMGVTTIWIMRKARRQELKADVASN